MVSELTGDGALIISVIYYWLS